MSLTRWLSSIATGYRGRLVSGWVMREAGRLTRPGRAVREVTGTFCDWLCLATRRSGAVAAANWGCLMSVRRVRRRACCLSTRRFGAVAAANWGCLMSVRRVRRRSCCLSARRFGAVAAANWGCLMSVRRVRRRACCLSARRFGAVAAANWGCLMSVRRVRRRACCLPARRFGAVSAGDRRALMRDDWFGLATARCSGSVLASRRALLGSRDRFRVGLSFGVCLTALLYG